MAGNFEITGSTFAWVYISIVQNYPFWNNIQSAHRRKTILRAFGESRYVILIRFLQCSYTYGWTRNFSGKRTKLLRLSPGPLNAHDNTDELYDRRIAFTHMLFHCKTPWLDTAFAFALWYDHSVLRGLRAPARWSGNPHGRRTHEYGLPAYDIIHDCTNNKHS